MDITDIQAADVIEGTMGYLEPTQLKPTLALLIQDTDAVLNMEDEYTYKGTTYFVTEIYKNYTTNRYAYTLKGYILIEE